MAETIYETIKDSDGVECFIKRGNLVRCKDCKFGEACKNGRGEHGVICYNSHSASHSWVHELNWFCADGEKAE